MKLAENKWTNKEGVTYITYKIGKMNEYGEGITVDHKIDFLLSMPPKVEPVTFFDKKTQKNKTFDSVKILAQPSEAFDNVVLHESYNTASFQLAEKYGTWIKDCNKGDTITVWLRSFEVEEEGKTIRRSTWDCNINGVNVKSGSSIMKKQNDDEVVKEVETKYPKPVQDIADAEVIISSPMKDLLEDKVPSIPEELVSWLNDFDENVEALKPVFFSDDILRSKNVPENFINWMSLNSECGTDYFEKIESRDNRTAKIAGLYWALCKRIGV